MNEIIDMVQIQRDELKMVLGDLYDKLENGVLRCRRYHRRVRKIHP